MIEIFYDCKLNGSCKMIPLDYTGQGEPNIDEALVSAFSYVTDPENMDENGNYPFKFSYKIWKNSELDFDSEEGSFIGFIVGNDFLGFIPLWIRDEWSSYYLMREWLAEE